MNQGMIKSSNNLNQEKERRLIHWILRIINFSILNKGIITWRRRNILVWLNLGKVTCMVMWKWNVSVGWIKIMLDKQILEHRKTRCLQWCHRVNISRGVKSKSMVQLLCYKLCVELRAISHYVKMGLSKISN